ncbi:MAG: AMP-binding protein [Cyclobacteriaceae bacterium]|nr:AMP-binding protein [Cyclobacteriaceae bacterium]
MAHDLLGMFLKWEHETPDLTFLQQPVSGEWKTWSFREAGVEIRKAAAGILSLRLPEKSNIAILSKNCAHWLMADLAINMSGHVSVPLYANITARSIRDILLHSESRAIFVGKLNDYAAQREGIPDGCTKIAIDFYGVKEETNWSHWQQLSPLAQPVERKPEELLTIMYTSGTTGTPKGVMFNNLAFHHTTQIVMEYARKFGPLPPHPVLLSYLPLCHIAERNLTENLGCYMGASISFVESLDTFGRDLASVQPHLFFGVPRIWAKFQEKILEKLPQQKLDRLLRIPILNNVIRKIIRKKLGLSRATIKGTGAAPIPVSQLQWFQSLGVGIREIYGMTENCALSHANQDDIRFGTVGKPMPSVEVKFSDENEILTRHPALMMGYYKEPALTATVITPDGFLKTGDQGAADKDGFVTITGRVKDVFKTDKGKYISPAPIEMRMLKNADIEHVCVVGMGIPQPIALVVLSALGRSKSKDEIIKSLTSSVAEVNPLVEEYERLKRAVIMKSDWTIANGLMTATMKVKRNEVEKIHMPTYPKWYAENNLVVWE